MSLTNAQLEEQDKISSMGTRGKKVGLEQGRIAAPSSHRFLSHLYYDMCIYNMFVCILRKTTVNCVLFLLLVLWVSLSRLLAWY